MGEEVVEFAGAYTCDDRVAPEVDSIVQVAVELAQLKSV